MTEGWERERKRELAKSIAEAMEKNGLTPLHLANDQESQAQFEMILQADVEAIPYMTLLRCSGAIMRFVSPLKNIDDNW